MDPARKLCCLVIVLACCFGESATTVAQPVLFPEPLSPRIANYEIDVSLDTEDRTLAGTQKLTWRNTTSLPATELQFHLYLNAFRNSESTFMKESGGSHRGNKIDADKWGYIEIDRLTLAGDVDLTSQLEFIQPDDGNPADKTVARVILPTPLPPGESVVVDFEFRAQLPQPPFARTGAKDEFFFVAQWFPKIGVYTEDGWNCHQFHANSEFFADFGVYDVRMTVPAENILGATGVEVSVAQNDDGTATHYYHAEDVHDFAWTTSPNYVEFFGEAQDVKIRVLMQSDRAYQGQRHLDATITAVTHFQDWYGDYPFPNLTVVDPRRGAGGAGGMEYPTLITAGTAYGLPEGLRAVELVIIHEFGHNYWYHLLASNEFEESWLDEGINTYTEIQIMEEAYGPQGDAIDLAGIHINNLTTKRATYNMLPDADPIVRNSWEFYSNTSYGVNSYSRPGVVLTTLQNYLGKERMRDVMRAYVAKWRFKHPKTQDFIDVANEVAGEDLNWFFEQALFSNAVLDYSVTAVSTRRVTEPKGFDFDLSVDGAMQAAGDNGDSDVASKDAENGVTDNADTADPVKMYSSTIKVRRLGEFEFPVEVEMLFEDGERLREQWDGKALWKTWRLTRDSRLVSATVDPDNKIPLDGNLTNNSAAVAPSRLGVNKLAIRWMFWTQFLLEQPDILNLIIQVPSLFN